MDSRLFFVGGRRPDSVRVDDIPALASALVALLRRRARLEIQVVQGLRVARILGASTDLTILALDWVQVHPILMDPELFTLSAGFRDPEAAFAFVGVDQADYGLYERLVGRLSGVFTTAWRTEET